MKNKPYLFPIILFLCAVAGFAAYGIFGVKRSATPRPGIAADDTATAAAPDTAKQQIKIRQADPVATAAPGESKPIATDIPAPVNPNFRLRPFKVVKTTATHQWTAEDCLTDAAIHEIAHNALEEQQLRKENLWTTRRQLVYRNENVGDFVGDLESGARKQFLVPGFDGQEFVVNVVTVDRLSADGFGVRGTIDGYPGSRFDLGYARGREAMTIDIPSQGLHYQINPREQNEVVVNAINLPNFQQNQPPMGEPIHNDDAGAAGSPPQ